MSRINSDLLIAEPYRRIRPMADEPWPVDYGAGGVVTDIEGAYRPVYDLIPRSEFLRELYPSGHRINDPAYFPDEYKQVEVKYQADNGETMTALQWVRQKVDRVAVPFQYIIKTQRNIHSCGNNIFFKDSNPRPSESDKDLLIRFKQLWLDRNMESHLYHCVDSLNSTGDALIAFYFDERKRIKARTYSYLDGVTVCRPVVDMLTGEPLIQAIKYSRYDEKQKAVCSYVDVWDRSTVTRFKMDLRGVRGAVSKAMEALGLGGYVVEQGPVAHGFPFLPLAYRRSRTGACWSNVQHLCDSYDLNVSQMCRNNRALSTAIFFLAGGDIDVKGMADGRPYAIISSDTDAKAEILTHQDASTAFDSTLKVLRDNIFLGSFAVMPPEVRSGDLPGIAIKLIYSPSLDQAMADAKEWDAFIDRMTMCFKYGAGIEMNRSSDFERMNINGSMIPYVHENTTELISNLTQSKLSGILSVETATQHNPYSTNDEFSIIERETRATRELEQEEVESLRRTAQNNQNNQNNQNSNE